MRFRREDAGRISACIQELEARTQAEVVLIMRRQSGSYRDTEYLFGAALSFALLLFLLFSPWEYDPVSFPLPLVLLFFAAAKVCHRLGLARGLTRAKRRHDQVRKSAAAAFVERHVDHTRKRTGILVYVSVLEREAEILADVGAQSALPPEKIAELQERLRAACVSKEPAERLAEFLRTFGVHLGRVLPAEDDADELDNTPELGTEEDV